MNLLSKYELEVVPDVFNMADVARRYPYYAINFERYE